MDLGGVCGAVGRETPSIRLKVQPLSRSLTGDVVQPVLEA